MKVVVYVEGPADKAVMTALLRPLLERKRQEGITIDFFDLGGKGPLLEKGPGRAVNILLADSSAVVVVLPDLYPRDVSFPHETYNQLREGLYRRFKTVWHQKAKRRKLLTDHFRVFCFKYDLETLVLAAEEELKKQLGIKRLRRTWQLPVEDQNHSNPPKEVVEALFQKYRKRGYQTTDAVKILDATRCSYHEIATKCPQCFKPFVEFIESLPEI